MTDPTLDYDWIVIGFWSRRSVILTVMQSTDVALRLRRGRSPGGLRTESDGDIGSVLAIANRIAALAARRIDGYAQTAKAEALGSAPTTAHFMGGAVIGRSPAEGVVDRDHRVFGYPHMLICDGSAVPANVGVNPSLTITALAERAISRIPEKTSPPTAQLDA